MPRKIIIERAERLHQIPPFEFSEFEKRYRFSKRRELEVIDLTDISLPAEVGFPFKRSLEKATFLSKSPKDLEAELGEKISELFLKSFGVRLNPTKEILVVPGVRSAMVNLMNSFLNPADLCLILDPSPPYHRAAVMLSQGRPETLPVFERNDYLLNFASISPKLAAKIKMMLLCYPHNPTGTTADLGFYREAVDFALRENIILINDASCLCPPGRKRTITLLQCRRAKRVAVEIHSFEYLCGLGAFDLSLVVGNREIIAGLKETLLWAAAKIPAIFYHVGLSALSDYEEFQTRLNSHLQHNRSLMTEGLTQMGWEVRRSHEVPFVWVRPPFVIKRDPAGKSSLRFSRMLLRRTGVKVLPGIVFGENGEGFVRISITPNEEKLTEALKRIKEHSHLWQKRYRPRREKT